MMIGFEAIQDVPLPLRAELGRKTISFRELLVLKIGSVLPLSRQAGENVDVYASDTYLGSGEILVIDGLLAVRMADISGSGPARSDNSPAAREDH
jgi:flagellar motor switch protein FliN